MGWAVWASNCGGDEILSIAGEIMSFDVFILKALLMRTCC
jgi:hypothetical protein